MDLIPIVAVVMIVLGLAFIYFIVRENDRPVPRGGVQWLATGLSGLLVLFAGLLLAFSLLPSSQPWAGGNVLPSEMNQPANDFTFRFVADDTEHSLSEYKGNVVLLNFWATWCAPCIEELPELNRLQQDYADEGLVVITLSDEQRDELVAFEEQMPLRTVSGYIPDTNLLPQPFQRTLSIRPTSYVIDRSGYLRFFVQGAGDYTYFEQAVLPYLQDDSVAQR